MYVQTYRQTDIQIDRQTDRQTYRHTYIQTDNQTNRQTDIQTDRQIITKTCPFSYDQSKRKLDSKCPCLYHVTSINRNYVNSW